MDRSVTRAPTRPAQEAAALPEPRPAVPPVLYAGRFEILALLGTGAYGTVYRARDRELDEIVALKVLRREQLRTRSGIDNFRREVRLARRVTHHNVARVFDLGEHAGERFLTMEFIDGEPLSRLLHGYIQRRAYLQLPQVVALMTQICAPPPKHLMFQLFPVEQQKRLRRRQSVSTSTYTQPAVHGRCTAASDYMRRGSVPAVA